MAKPDSQTAAQKTPTAMFRSSFIVSLLAALGSVVSFVGQLVLARFFGAGAELDAYFVAISLPLTIAGLWGGILGYQVVPALRREESADRSLPASLLGMLAGLGGCTILVAAAGIALTPILVPVLVRDLPAASLPIVSQASMIAWTWLPLAVAGAILTGGLHARQQFFLATALQPLPALGAMVGCLLAHESLGVNSLAWGQLVGYCLMVAVFFIVLRLPHRAPDWRQTSHILRESPLALGALLVFVIYPLPDAIWGPQAGTSGVSLLAYAQRLVVGFAGLAAVGSATVLFPRLARQAAAGEQTAFAADLSRSLRIILAAMAPAAAVLGVLALPLVRFLFQRGAFGDQEAVALAELLHWMFAGMVPMSLATLVFKALFAQQRVRLAAGFSLAGTVVYVTLAGLLVKAFGLPGIGAAYVMTWCCVVGLGVFALRATTRQDVAFSVQLIITTTLCGGSAWAVREMDFAQQPGQGNSLLTLGAAGVASVIVFLATSLGWPGVDEVKAIKKDLLG